MIDLVQKDIVKAHEELSQILEVIQEDEETKQSEVYKQAIEYMTSNGL